MALSIRQIIFSAGLTLLAASPLAAQAAVEDAGAAIPLPSLDPANPCSRVVKCPDPLTLDTADIPVAGGYQAPDAKPAPQIKSTTSRIVWIRDPNGRLVRTRLVERALRAGGHTFTARPGDAPWMAQIERPVFVKAAVARALTWEDRQFCGGSLIARGWIVTAAHCLNDYGKDIKSAGYRVRLGLSDIQSGLQGISYAIDQIVEHPDFPKSHEYYNDIGLIHFTADDRTRADAGGTRRRVAAIAVDAAPFGVRQIAGNEAWFYGWGTTDSQHPSAPLQYGKIKLAGDRVCSNPGIALCGRGVGARGATQCHGDSGGPLVFNDNDAPLLIGLVSHNTGKQDCGVNEKQGVFTRVAAFRLWIEGYTGPLPSPPRVLERRPQAE